MTVIEEELEIALSAMHKLHAPQACADFVFSRWTVLEWTHSAQRRLTASTSKAADHKKGGFTSSTNCRTQNSLDRLDENFEVPTFLRADFFSRINLPRKQEALKEACIHPAPKGVGETSSRPTLVTKKGDSIHPTWTKHNLKMAKSGWFGQCHSSIFTCHEFIFIIFLAQKSCKDIHRGCFSGNGGLQDLLDDPEGSQGFCLLNNVAIGAAYASGYPCGFPENEGWKDKIPPCHDKRFFSTFVPLH